MTQRPSRPEPRLLVRLVDPEVPPEEDPTGERIDKARTLEARKVLAEAAEKEHRPHGLPLMARSVQKLWNPRVDTSDVRLPSKDEVEAVTATRTDGPSSFHVCVECVHFHHGEGQRLLWEQGLAEEYQAGLGEEGVRRLGDLREYGYCEGLDNLCHPFKPVGLCVHFIDKTRTLGKLIGGARGFWRRLGGF